MSEEVEGKASDATGDYGGSIGDGLIVRNTLDCSRMNSTWRSEERPTVTVLPAVDTLLNEPQKRPKRVLGPGAETCNSPQNHPFLRLPNPVFTINSPSPTASSPRRPFTLHYGSPLHLPTLTPNPNRIPRRCLHSPRPHRARPLLGSTRPVLRLPRAKQHRRLAQRERKSGGSVWERG